MSARAKPQQEQDLVAPVPETTAPQSAVRLAGETSAEHPSPALGLQQDLAARLDEWHTADERRWSTRATLAFCVGVSLLLWAGIAAAVLALR